MLDFVFRLKCLVTLHPAIEQFFRGIVNQNANIKNLLEIMKMTNFQIERQLNYRLRISVVILGLLFFSCINTLHGQGFNNFIIPSNQAALTAEEILYNYNLAGGQGSRENPEDYLYPPIWATPESSRIEPHFLIVTVQSNPRLGNIPLLRGDYIGAFFVGDNGTLVCGGAGYWKADSTIIFAITGDDPQTTHKEGFSYGEVINYKLFSFTTMKDYTVNTISFDTSPGSGFISGVKWYTLGLSSTTNVKANVTFDAYATATPNPICIGGSSQLNATVFIGPGEPYTYSWTSNPPGFTSTLKNPVVNPIITTQYLLTAQSGTLSSQHNVTVIVNQEPVVNAGTDGTVCGNQTHLLSGSAQNYTAISWTTSGNGTFSNLSTLNPVYTPGYQDVSAGQITLSLIASPLSPCSTSYTDMLSLTVLPIPTIAAGNDKQVCGNDLILLTATGLNYGAIQWTTSGTGSFTQPTSLQTQYQPSTADVSTGSVTLTVCASSVQPCVANVCDALTVSFLPGPTASAPPTKVTCENMTANITGSATNYSSVLWTTAGDGTFNNPNALAIAYTPGPNDKINGIVTVTFNVFPLQPCTTTTTKQTVITVKKLPVVNAGTTDMVCKNTSLQLNGSATSYNGLAWTTSGDGTFTNTYTLNPIYFPGTSDNAAGAFNLVLKGTASVPCTLPDYDTLHVTIINNPSVQISTQNNLQICQVPAFQLNATASSYSQVQWTTSGDGTFNNPATLNPAYTMGTGDLTSGLPVTFTLTAFAISPCLNSAQSSISASFVKLPVANAGNDNSICEGETHQLSGTANNYAGLTWTTSGTGAFSSTTILNPIYTPSIADINAGTMTLTLTALPNSPCTSYTADIKILNIQKSPVGNAGPDATICQGSTHQLSGNAQNQSSVLWTTSGTGTFSNTSILSPVYTPSASDITTETVTLTLTASAISPCLVSATDTKILTIQKNPIGNAGADFTICQGSTHQLSGNAQNQSSVLWTTSGTGTFSNSGIVNPVYTPSTADITSGTATLTLTVLATSPCTASVSDSKILTIQKAPIVNAGTDATTLENENFLVSATASNYTSLLWQTNGDGTFSNPALLNPVYFPGASDIENSNVILTISASPNNPCAGAATDALTLTIMRQQIIQIPAGWSGISSFVLPLNPAFAAVMSPVANNLIVAKNMMEVYWPEFGINTIGNFDPANGYMVKMNAPAALPIIGFEFENKTISLTAGWNILPVLSGVNVNAQLLIGQLGNKLIIVTEIAGTGIIWPEEGIYTIPFLIPGKAYMIKISSPGFFTFPD